MIGVAPDARRRASIVSQAVLRLGLACAVSAASVLASADLQDGLPAYEAERRVSGPIRSIGGTLGGQIRVWEERFLKYHPEIRFVDSLWSSEASIGGLYSVASDLGPSGREAQLMDLLPFVENFGYLPLEITVATGSFDPGKKGGSGSLAVFVHKENPISRLTMGQLDGIFGAERTGGFKGVVWTPELGRSRSDDIRVWGQLGLRGNWAVKPINTYGYAFTGMRYFFQLKVFGGADKWNPNYREYVETESKMVDRDGPAGPTVTIAQMLHDLSQDRYGIAYCPLHYAREFPLVKPVALAARDGGPYVEPTWESFQDRTYPLTRSIYIYLNRDPAQPVDPKLREFLRYVLSREGQQAVVDHGRYLPLPAHVVREQLRKLD